MTRPARDLLGDIIWIAARAAEIAPRVVPAHAALRDAQPGFPTSVGGGGSAPRLNDDGTPTGLDRFITQRDQAAADMYQLDVLLRTVRLRLADLYRIVSEWDAEIEPGAQPERKRTASGGDCVACGAYCSGAATDRLRAGLCVACYHDRRRSNLERGDWLLERRRRTEIENEKGAA